MFQTFRVTMYRSDLGIPPIPRFKKRVGISMMSDLQLIGLKLRDSGEVQLFQFMNLGMDLWMQIYSYHQGLGMA